MEGHSTQQKTEQLLKSMKGLKMKETQQQAQTQCQFPESEMHSQIDQSNCIRTPVTPGLISEFMSQKSQTNNNSLFSINCFKIPQNIDIFKKKQNIQKLAFPKSYMKDNSVIDSQEDLFKAVKINEQFLNFGHQQGFNKRLTNNYLRSQISKIADKQTANYNNFQQKSVKVQFSPKNIFTKKQRNDIENMTKKQIINQDQFKQKTSHLQNQKIDETNEQQKSDKTAKYQNHLQIVSLSPAQQSEIQQIYIDTQNRRKKRCLKNSKQISTSYLDFYDQIYLKIKLRHPGYHQQELVGDILSLFKKQQKYIEPQPNEGIMNLKR